MSSFHTFEGARDLEKGTEWNVFDGARADWGFEWKG
jgi:hypothetical protein